MNEIFENRELFACSAVIFWAAFASGVFSARRGNDAGSGRRFVELFFASAAWTLLSLALGVRGTECGHLPVSNIFEIFQVLGWCAVFSVVFLRVVWGLRVPAFFATGTAGVLCTTGFLNVRGWDILPVSAEAFTGTPWVSVHAVFATVGYAFFSAAAMVWGIFLLQNSALRKRRTHRFFSKLPDLSTLDRISARLCSAGTVFFGVGVAVGVAVLAGNFSLGSSLAIYKTAVSLLVFCGFSFVRILHGKNRISALKFARAGTAIFVVAIILLGGMACLRDDNGAASATILSHGEKSDSGGAK